MGKAANKLYSRAQVRDELHALRHEITNTLNAHLAACIERHGKPYSERGNQQQCGRCHFCIELDSQMWGIATAIKHFGGRLCDG